MAANIVPISFKNNTYEMYMYSYLKIKSSPSSYIKELLEKDEGFVEYMCTVDSEHAVKNGKKIREEDVPKSEVVTNTPKPTNDIVNVSSLFK